MEAITLSLEEKLIAIQTELKAPKGQYNNFGKYKYRSLEDILEGLKPLLSKYGCALTISDQPELVGNRIYIKATAALTSGSSRLEVSAFAREAENKKGMDESQISGTASSYARKYCLNGLFLIDDTKDADSNEHYQQQQPRQQTHGEQFVQQQQSDHYQNQQDGYYQQSRGN